MEPNQAPANSPAIPIAIVVGFAMIALAIFFTSSSNSNSEPAQVVSEQAQGETVVATDGPRPVDDSDYIRGNPNAPILFIEYSDYDCPFCKEFHDTMKLIMDEFGVDGRVAWVYRQFPIEQLHPNSPRVSAAALCVGELGGNTAFWQFTDLIFEQREFDTQTNVLRLAEYAERVGVAPEQYNACMNSGRTAEEVLASVEDGFNAGIRGTPYTYVVAGNQQATISGSRSYESIRGVVTNLLSQLDGTLEPVEQTEIPIEATELDS